MITPICRANYSLRMIKVIMYKFSPVNCETILVSIKNIHFYVKNQLYLFWTAGHGKELKTAAQNLVTKIFWQY